jgi:hypothetical protein
VISPNHHTAERNVRRAQTRLRKSGATMAKKRSKKATHQG